MQIPQISSILKAAKNQRMSETMYDSSNKKQLVNSRSRPYIEKVKSQNKNHLPPPPIGKTVGHGLWVIVMQVFEY